jgi:hypothetical protein
MMTDSPELSQDTSFCPSAHYGGECPGVDYLRLQRCGWILRDRLSAGVTETYTIFEKPLARGWLLRKYAHAETGAPPGKGCYWDQHELENDAHLRLSFPHWEWADLDGKRLVWAEGGCLYTAGLKAKGPDEPRLLFDFNGMTFERRIAPY